ncbi:hypothetical protein Tther_00979 [Tepidimonas thermarum]|uniref:DUF3108 domain-containing protein n=2 Tax=Tepidimonas thermarum TaxID=335431 RepID=A0A554X3K7_9BURK|nr:hypothetical protein Tther_00979 [Tepidimonas thermarum]
MAVLAAVAGAHALALGWAWTRVTGSDPDGGLGAAPRAPVMAALLPAAPPSAVPTPAVPRADTRVHRTPSRSQPPAPRAADSPAVAPDTPTPALAAQPPPPALDALPGDVAPDVLQTAASAATERAPLDTPGSDAAEAVAVARADARTQDVPPPPAWMPPPPAHWEYEVTGEARGLPYRATAILHWQTDGTRYQAELTMRAFWVGSRTQTSSGTVGPAGLRPQRFEDRARNARWIAFDWPADDGPGTARLHSGVTVERLPSGTQDRLSVFVQLGGWMATAAPGQRWAVPVMGAKQLESWAFAAGVHERLTVPAGTFDAVRVQRVAGPGNGPGVELWFSPVLPGLPVRIRVQQADGDWVDQRLRALLPNPASP